MRRVFPDSEPDCFSQLNFFSTALVPSNFAEAISLSKTWCESLLLAPPECGLQGGRESNFCATPVKRSTRLCELARTAIARGWKWQANRHVVLLAECSGRARYKTN